MKPIVFLCLLLVACLNANLNAMPLRIDSLQAIQINGSKQWVLIRTSDPSNPILLYLHGGPGHSLIPFAHVATSSLTDRFTVVYWDQRGTGLSYEAAFPAETLNLKQLIEDTLAVTDYLRRRFDKEKIYLVGHSWGSTLGSLVMQKEPEKFHAFIGVGQIVSQRSLYAERLARLTTEMKTLLSFKDRNELALIKPTDPVSIRYIRKYGGFIHNISLEQLQAIRDSSPYCPEKYTDALYEKGGDLSQSRLEKEIMTIDLFKQAREVLIPVYFFWGNTIT
jgi:pimeloyl-ACP methyl ester carboxylesterase